MDSFLKGDQLKKSNFSGKIIVWRTVIKTVFKSATFSRFEEVVELRVLTNFSLLRSSDLEGKKQSIL